MSIEIGPKTLDIASIDSMYLKRRVRDEAKAAAGAQASAIDNPFRTLKTNRHELLPIDGSGK